MTPSSAPPPPSRLFLHLLPSLILATIGTVLFWWNPFGSVPEHARFEVQMRSDTPGWAQLLPDIDGSGLHNELAVVAPVAGGGARSHLRFTVTAGRLAAFIFAPLAGTGEVTIERCWFANESGQILAEISPAALRRYDQGGGGAGADGALHLHAGAGQTITGLHFEPDPPIELAEQLPPPPEQLLAVFVLSLLVCTTLSLKLAGRLGAVRRGRRRVLAWCGRNPRRALLGAALLAVSLSCFPVIFAGKSFVSPDTGPSLLYMQSPTAPGAAGGRVTAMGSDIGATMLWHMPASMIEAHALFDDGEFPLWCRHNSGGVTLLGQGISMIGDPLHWLTIATRGASWAWDVKFLLAKLLFAWAVGLLVWRTARSLPVALALTLSAPFIGFFTYRFCHAAFFSLCYAPWILLAWVEGRRAATVRRAVPWAALLILADWCELSSGTAKESSMLLIFINAAGALGLLLACESGRWRAARLALFGWASVLFLLLSAPLWMVFLDALGKAYTIYERQEICQLQPGLLIGLFDDIFQRQFMPNEFLFSPSANFFILLGAAWSVVRLRPLVRERWFLAALLPALPAAAIAFGVVPQSVLNALPMIRTIYHFDNTFSCVLFILLFVIAGFGLREALARVRSAEWTGDLALVIALVGVLFAGFLGLTEASHRVGISLVKMGHPVPKSAFFWQYAPGLVAALALLPWAVRAVLRGREGALAWAAVAVVAFVTLHFRHGMYGATRFDLYTMSPKPRLDLRHLTSPALTRVRPDAEPARVVGLDWELSPGFNTTLGLETISGPDALMSPAYVALAQILGIQRVWDWRLLVSQADFPLRHRALDLLNVRYLLVRPGQPDLPETKLLGRDDLTVYESATAWPRAFFTDTVTPYASGAEFRQLVEQGDGRAFAAMPVGSRELPSLPPREHAARRVVPARDYRLTSNTTTFTIDAPAPGVAVLMETNAPGDIEVSVDGRRASCLTVDHAFRGVFIGSAGPHTVRFAYRPAILGLALRIGAAGLCGLLGSAWLLLRRKAAGTGAGTVPAKADVRVCLTTSP